MSREAEMNSRKPVAGDRSELTGYGHARDAALLIAFDQQLPPGQKPLLPMP